MNWRPTLLLLCLSCGVVFAQEFNISRVEFKDQKIRILYDLADSVTSRTYTINVYASTDNYTLPLKQVSGDLGLEVSPGGKKVIVWDPIAELGGEFNGKVGLEVRGRVYIPFVRVDGFKDESVTIKRGSPYQLTWSGGTAQNILNFELYKGSEKITVFPNVANVGHHSFVLPTTVKPGGGYKFKITDTKNKDEVVFTGTFKVRRKIPLVMKAIPLLVVGGGVSWLLTRQTDPDWIPDPPKNFDN